VKKTMQSKVHDEGALVRVDFPDMNEKDITILVPKKYELNGIIDFNKVKDEGFNMIINFETLGKGNHIHWGISDNNGFKVSVKDIEEQKKNNLK